MAANDELLQAYGRHMGRPYAQSLERQGLASTVAEARGATIVTGDGRKLIDFVAGFGVFNFGHNPPQVVRALAQALGAQPLWNRPFLSEPFAKAAAALVKASPPGLERVLFTSSGAEAVDSAIKLARLATGRQGVVAAEGGFHGFTLGALSVSGIPAQSRYFEPLLPGVRHVPFGDGGAMAAAVDASIAAVILEPVQAEIGAITPPAGYLREVREICERNGALLIVDEVRTGMGRTGPMFAVEEEGVTPDILLTGKSLAAGIVPIGALLAPARLWTRVGLSFAMSASSFGGNRLACTAAAATLDLVRKKGLLQQGEAAGAALEAALKDLPTGEGVLQQVTGRGLLRGIHFADPRTAADVVRRTIERGVLVAAAFCNPSCILLEPPLVANQEQIRRGVAVLSSVCREIADEPTKRSAETRPD